MYINTVSQNDPVMIAIQKQGGQGKIRILMQNCCQIELEG